MSREIKFRVWNEELEEMYKLKKVNYLGSTGITDPYVGGDKSIWMQYTGLKDNSGVEIYEGDIVHTEKGYIQKVEHITETIDGSTYVSGFYAWDEEKHTWMALDVTDKVIGNIYENPELLEAIK